MNTSGRSFRPWAIVCFDSLGARPSWSRMTHGNRSTDMNSICSPQNPTARTPCHNKACWLRQFQPGCPARMTAKKADLFWRSQKFAPPISISGANGAAADPGYRDSIAAYAAWRSTDRPVAMRCAALAFALRGLTAACARAPTAGRLSTLARVAWEWGARGQSVGVLQRLLKTVRGGPIELGEAFWPASARFDNIAPGSQPADWFVAAAAEQFERTFGFSSSFVGASPVLAWLCSQPSAPAEMERRRILLAARAGQRPKVPSRLRIAASDHLNADVWRAGQIPGTVAEP